MRFIFSFFSASPSTSVLVARFDHTENMDPIPRPSSPQTRRPSKRRSKTFTGCQTCRTRRVKCDEARPVCRRCTKGGIECSGYYGYRGSVQWRPVRGPSDFTSMPAARRGSEQQELSDLRAAGNDQPSSDPTMTLRSATASHAHASSAPYLQGSLATLPPVEAGTPQVELVSSPGDSPPISPSTSASRSSRYVALQVSRRAQHLRLSPVLPDERQRDCGIGGYEPGTLSSRDDSICSTPAIIRSLDHTDLGQDARFTRHIDLLSSMDLQRRCMEHWINHLSDSLSSVPGSINPLRKIFVPIAYHGATTVATSSTGATALFYLVCSAAAFHLSSQLQDEKQKSDFMNLALTHHNQGIRHLQHSLVTDDSSQKESVLASLLMCITFEPATVERNFWLTHLRGASQWLHKADVKSWAYNDSTRIMYQMVACTATMLRSQLLSDEIAQPANFHFEMGFVLEPYHLHHIFGLPKRTFELISYMVELVVKTNQDIQHQLSTRELEQLEMELYLSVPVDCEIPIPSKDKFDLIHHYSQIFYFGSIIYCKRRLKGSPLSEVQALVKQAFYHIEALANCTTRPFSPLLWPIAVVFFDSLGNELRARALVWLDFIIQRSTLSLWQKFKPLLCAFWELRTVPGQEESHWDAFLADPSTPSVMLV